MEGEEATVTGRAGGGTTEAVVGADEALEVTTERPNDFRRATNWDALICSSDALLDMKVLAFCA